MNQKCRQEHIQNDQHEKGTFGERLADADRHLLGEHVELHTMWNAHARGLTGDTTGKNRGEPARAGSPLCLTKKNYFFFAAFFLTAFFFAAFFLAAMVQAP